MSKLYLPARVPNEGARQLAQWAISRNATVNVALTRLWRAERISRSLVDRFMTGEVVPGERLAVAIAKVSDGQIDRRMWRRKPRGWWFDNASGMRRAA